MFPCADMTTPTVTSCLCQLFALFGKPAYIQSDRAASFMSREFLEFLMCKSVASSRTTSYNPQGNGQTESYNGIIWKAITMALKSRNLPPKCWQIVLPDALHSIRSLLSTATNVTPHERLFNFARRYVLWDPSYSKGMYVTAKPNHSWTKWNFFKRIRSALMSATPMPRNNGAPPAFGPNRRVVSR